MFVDNDIYYSIQKKVFNIFKTFFNTNFQYRTLMHKLTFPNRTVQNRTTTVPDRKSTVSDRFQPVSAV